MTTLALDVPPNTIAVAVAVQGLRPFAALVPADRYLEVLQNVERGLGLGRAKRFDKAAQLDVREKLYGVVKNMPLEVAGPGFGQAALWLAVNHHANGAEIRRELSDLLRRNDRAVVSVFIIGDSEQMRWGFAVGEEAVDFSEVLGVMADEPFMIVAPPGDTPGPMLS